MRRGRTAVAAALCGASIGVHACGTLQGVAGTQAPDAADGSSGSDAADGSPSVDGGVVVAHCDPTRTFSSPVRYTAIPDSYDHVWLTQGGLEGFFSGNPDDAGYDILHATRADANASFSFPGELAPPSGTSYDDRPTLTADGLNLLFVSDRGGARDLYLSTRADSTSPFGSAALVGSLAAAPGAVDVDPWLTIGGAVYFASNRGDFVRFRLYSAAAAGLGWGAPALVKGLEGIWVRNAVLTEDELVVFFTSTGGPDDGELDVWSAWRKSTSEPFGAPVRSAELSTSGVDDRPTFTSRDGCTIYVTRVSPAGIDQIWSATRL